MPAAFSSDDPSTPGKPRHIAFIGGGNIARAIVGGLRASAPSLAITVVEPSQPGRDALTRDFGVQALAAAGEPLRAATVVVWAVKPQSFAEAAAPCRGLIDHALQLSVMAGIRSADVARATRVDAVVRAMPNTPALIGQGITGLFARPGVDEQQRDEVQRILAPTGEGLWLDDEAALDAVTALSGSGPAYVFYVLEAMIEGGVRVGLAPEHARQLALATLQGATALAAQSNESPRTLRERVTSPGGTTHAAVTLLDQRQVGSAIEDAIVAARDRATQMGDLFAVAATDHDARR